MPAPAGPLLEQLRREAEAAIAERAAAAHAEAERIRETAAAQRARRCTTALAEREQALAREREEARARVAQSTVHDVLTARAAFLTRVFESAEHRLDALADAPDLADRLTPLFGEALPFLPADDLRARCRPGQRETVARALAAAGCGDAPIESDDAVPTGAVLENRAGTVRVDATLVARLRRMRATLAIDAVRAVEEEAS
jgi:vacuolar-type H+-ATPase subunit E/Vma4